MAWFLHEGGLVLCLLAAVAVAQPLVHAQERAQALLEAGDADGALELLRPLFASYDQDTRLALQVGWVALEAEELPLAEEAFLRAVTLSAGASEARQGLAWTYLATGRRPEAQRELDLLEAKAPGDPSLEALREALAPRVQDRVQGALSGFVAAPGQAVALGGGGRLGWQRTGERGSGGVVADVMAWTPRGSGAQAAADEAVAQSARWGPPASGAPGGAGSAGLGASSPWAQGSEALSADLSVWGRLGTGNVRGGVEGVGGLLAQTRLDLAPGWVVGGLVRWSPAGDLVTELSYTQPRASAQPTVRIATSWWLPIGTLALKPGASVQLLDGVSPAAQAGLWWLPERGAVWVGGRYGAQAYRTDLSLAVTTSWPEASVAQLWAGVRVGRFAERWLALGWVGDRFDVDPVVGWAHQLTLTLSTPVAARP